MSAHFKFLVVLLVFVFVAGPFPDAVAEAPDAAASLEEAPRLIYGRFQPDGIPIWISRSESVSTDGELRSEIFDRGAQSRLSRYVAKARELKREGRSAPTGTRFRPATAGVDCMVYMAAPVPLVFPPRTLHQLVEETPYLVAGRVERVSDGFFRGVPASLLRLVDVQAINYPVDAPSALYVVYYDTAFVIAGQEYCSGGFPDRPEPGTRVIVGSPAGPLDEGGRLIEPLRWSVFIEDSKGEVIVPPNYTEEANRYLIDGIPKLVQYLADAAEDD